MGSNREDSGGFQIEAIFSKMLGLEWLHVTYLLVTTTGFAEKQPPMIPGLFLLNLPSNFKGKGPGSKVVKNYKI